MAAGGLYAYRKYLELSRQDWPFSALIWAAMGKADSENIERLKSVFPDLWGELQERYWTPGGLVKGEALTEPVEAEE